MEAVDARILSAKQEVIVATRALSAISILKNLLAKEAAGVPVFTLLSPDTLPAKAQSDLVAWMRQNRMTGVYQDAFVSGSYVIVIDESTVIISDLPFSQKSFESADPSTAVRGFVTIIDNPALAKGMADDLKARILEKNKIL